VNITRSRHSQQFVVVTNEIARCTSLSFRARGLLVMLLSLPDGWNVTTTQLAEDNPEGRDAIRRALGELQRAGYARVLNRQDERGRWSRWTEVYDQPQPPVDDSTEVRKTSPRSDLGKREFPQVTPKTGKPTFGEPGQILKTVTEDGSKYVGPKDGPPGGAQASSRRGAGPSKSYCVIKAMQRSWYGGTENLSDEEMEALYVRLLGDRRVKDPVAYLTKIFNDTPDVQTLMAKVHDDDYDDDPDPQFARQQAQRDAIVNAGDSGDYGRCPKCETSFTVWDEIYEGGLCKWCAMQQCAYCRGFPRDDCSHHGAQTAAATT
jgi:hypothetical protein